MEDTKRVLENTNFSLGNGGLDFKIESSYYIISKRKYVHAKLVFDLTHYSPSLSASIDIPSLASLDQMILMLQRARVKLAEEGFDNKQYPSVGQYVTVVNGEDQSDEPAVYAYDENDPSLSSCDEDGD